MLEEQPLAAPVVRLSAEFHLGRSDFAAGLRAYYRHTGILRRRFLALIGLVSVGIALAVWLQELWRQPTLLAVVCGFTLGVLVLYARLIESMTVNASLRMMAVATAPGITGTRRLQVTDDELLVATEVTRLACRLDVLKIVSSDELIVVLFPGGLFLPVPNSGSFHRESFATFCDKLEQSIAAAKAKRTGTHLR